MGSRRRWAFTRSQCLVSSFSSARSFLRSASHWSRETMGGCGIVLVVIYSSSELSPIPEPALVSSVAHPPSTSLFVILTVMPIPFSPVLVCTPYRHFARCTLLCSWLVG